MATGSLGRQPEHPPYRREVAGPKAILEFVAGVFDGAGLPAVPLQQADSVLFQVLTIARDGGD